MRVASISYFALFSLALCACPNPSASDSTSGGTTGGSNASDSTSGATQTDPSGSTTPDPSATTGTLPPGSGCCAPHDGPGCNEAAVQSCVCDMSPVCCGFDWDDSCVEIAQARCDATCEADMTTSDSDSTGGRTSSADTTGTGGSFGTGFGTEFGSSSGDFGDALCCYEGTGCDHPGTEQCVCDLDPTCCNGEWSQDCVTLATDSCNACTSDDCCAPQNDAGCSDMTVQDCVCAIDDYCCNNEWDYLCVEEAQTECSACAG